MLKKIALVALGLATLGSRAEARDWQLWTMAGASWTAYKRFIATYNSEFRFFDNMSIFYYMQFEPAFLYEYHDGHTIGFEPRYIRRKFPRLIEEEPLDQCDLKDTTGPCPEPGEENIFSRFELDWEGEFRAQLVMHNTICESDCAVVRSRFRIYYRVIENHEINIPNSQNHAAVRWRLSAEILKNKYFSLFTSEELSYNHYNNQEFDRSRFRAGFLFDVYEGLEGCVYYQYQSDKFFKSRSWQGFNALGLCLYYHF